MAPNSTWHHREQCLIYIARN